MAASDADDPAEQVRSFALGFPDAYEDYPWEERVVKVGKKVFVFLGAPETPEVTVTVKLRDGHEEALAIDFTSPSGYGLGRHGWVTARIESGAQVPVELLCDWIDESYRLVAGKRQVAELDRRTGQ
jgi:predicted DNA-binding protein (MmcQ/YjbR family)